MNFSRMKIAIPDPSSFKISLVILTFIGLYFTSLKHFLLFHSLAEIYSIIVAGTIFVIAINSKKYISNKYIYFVGISCLFVGFLDLLHTLSYKGMNIFTDYDFYANQVWIATRYMESLTFLFGFYFLGKNRKFNEVTVYLGYLAITVLVILSIFSWKIFPVCFVEGEGLTLFKIVSEYLICSILITSLFLLRKLKAHFHEKIYFFMICSIVFTVASELFFTFYISNYGISNLVGHYFKIISYIFIYKAIVETGIREPFNLIFRELAEKQEKLEALSTQDSLTGLLNRRAFLEKCRYEMGRASRHGISHGLILGDIDGFKKINDTQGHVFGDLVLRTVADIFNRNLRAQDSVCRWGGEEFLILVPDCNEEDAGTVAEKLRSAVENHLFPQGATRVDCSISFGVAELNTSMSLEESIQVADGNLYHSKQAGKNRVTLG